MVVAKCDARRRRERRLAAERGREEDEEEDEAGLLAVSGRPFPGVRYMVRMLLCRRYMGTEAVMGGAGGVADGNAAMLRCYDARVEGCPCSVLNLACPDATKIRPTRLL